MKRQTSIEAYHQIKAEGLLSERRLQVYQILYKYGPVTAAQVVEIARNKMKVSNSGNFATRLSELRRMGVAFEVKTGPCPLTGRNVIHWDVNGELPAPLVKKKTHKELLLEAVRIVKEQDRTKGYPTGLEWMELINEIKRIEREI